MKPPRWHMVAGGCHSGGLGWWDTRAGPEPAAVVDSEQGHVAPVYRWIYLPLLLTISPPAAARCGWPARRRARS